MAMFAAYALAEIPVVACNDWLTMFDFDIQILDRARQEHTFVYAPKPDLRGTSRY